MESRAPLDLDRLRSAVLGPDGVARLDVVAETDSTNADLVRAAAEGAEAYPDLSVRAAEYQAHGRGRLDRSWTAPARSAMLVSVLLRPAGPGGAALPVRAYAWLSLLAALAAVAAVESVAGVTAALKWPNDVLVGDRKLAGILAQLGPAGDDGLPPVVVGTGLNVDLAPADLPVPTATSLRAELAELSAGAGADRRLDRTALLDAYLHEFSRLYRAFCRADGDATAGLDGGPSLKHRVTEVMATLGQSVRAQLPGDHQLIGIADRLDDEGALRIVDAAGREHTVTAGDVIHLRRHDGGNGSDA